MHDCWSLYAVKPQFSQSTVLSSEKISLSSPHSGHSLMVRVGVRMKAELDPIQSQINRLEKLLGGEFAHKAPKAVVEKERAKLLTYRESAQKLREQLKHLED